MTAKVREWDPKKGTFNLDYILRLVSAEAKKAFSKFERTYFYHDYTKLLKSMDLEQLNQYLNTAFVRVDRMSSVMWYTRSRKGTWHPISTPFRKPNDHVFTYEVKNPKYKPNDKECKEPEMKTKATTLGSYIISNQLRHVPNYEDLQFLPFYGKDPTPRGVFNTFSGYRHEILSDEEYDPDSEGFQFIMKHWLDIMCNKNQEFCDYLMNWLGWLLRFGYKKPRTAIVMHGPPGLGKDTMWTDFLWHGILGEPYAHKETNMKRFTDRFNMKRLGKCLHIFNECTSTQHGSKVSWDAMKAIITDRDFMAEPKGKEAFQAIDCAGCILLSNHDKPCNIANNDRRYAVVSMAREVPGAEYFKRLRSLVKSTVMQRTFMTYLVKRDISKWNMADIPQTESRNEIIDTNWENRILDFLADLVTGQESTNDVQWFNAEFNETRLKPNQRWYNSTLIWPAFDTYLKGKGFNRYTNNRVNITKKLKKAGLKIGRHTCRSWYGTNKEDEEKKLRGSAPRHAWHLDKESIQQLHRAYLSRPNWNYPE